jgi:hypothetical protein
MYNSKAQKLHDWINSVGVLAAIIISIIGIHRGCSNEKKNDAFIYRPKLEILKNIDVLSFGLGVNSFFVDSDTLVFNVRPDSFRLQLMVVNTGSSQANFIGYIIADTLKGTKMLRDLIFEKPLRGRSKISSALFDKFYVSHTIAPGDTFPIEVNKGVQFIGANPTFCIHLLLLYGDC